MGLLVTVLQNTFGLNATEIAAVETAMPVLADIVKEFNADQDTIATAYGWIVRAAPVVDRLLGDYKTMGPVIVNLLEGGTDLFALPGFASAAKDIQATLNANTALIMALATSINKFQPLVAKINANMPVILPALQAIQTALVRKNVSVGYALQLFQEQLAKTFNEDKGA